MKLYFLIDNFAFRTDDVLAIFIDKDYDIRVQVRGIQETFDIITESEKEAKMLFDKALRDWEDAMKDEL